MAQQDKGSRFLFLPCAGQKLSQTFGDIFRKSNTLSSLDPVPLSSVPRRTGWTVCTVQTAGLTTPLMEVLSIEESRKEVVASPQGGKMGAKDNGGV